VPNSLALLSHAYPDEKARGRAVGVWAAGASLALTAGPCRESPDSCKNLAALLPLGAPLRTPFKALFTICATKPAAVTENAPSVPSLQAYRGGL